MSASDADIRTAIARQVKTAIGALRQRGLLADRVQEIADDSSAASSAKQVFKGVQPKSLQIFSRQFATMIEAGMNVVTSLLILEQQTAYPVRAPFAAP